MLFVTILNLEAQEQTQEKIQPKIDTQAINADQQQSAQPQTSVQPQSQEEVFIKAQKFLIPNNLKAKGYAGHVEITWDNTPMFKYNIYRSQDGSKYKFIASTQEDNYIDFAEDPIMPHSMSYLILPIGMEPDDPAAPRYMISAQTKIYTTEQLIDMIQMYTTRYFTDYADPITKMVREKTNNKNGNIVTTGGTGFGVMAMIAAAERNFMTDSAVISNINSIVNFLNKAERFRGAWAHWYNVETAKPFYTQQYNDGGDLVETAFLVQGLLTAKSWLNKKQDSLSVDIAKKIDKMWNEVDWQWYTQGGKDSLYCHWSKNHGWKMNKIVKGFDETLITYILAASSPTYPINSSVYHKCYANSKDFKNDSSYFDIKLSLGQSYGGPLLYTHHSFLGLNPNGLKDQYADYFIQNQSHAMIHYKYAVNNPKKNLGLCENVWGFTISEDPIIGHSSHLPNSDDENGTIAPTAAISSIIYTPKESIKALEFYYYNLGNKIFGKYGFYDAFNLGMIDGQQVVHTYVADNQGPIPIMLENYRSQLLWDLFMQNEDVRKGLRSLGFTFPVKE